MEEFHLYLPPLWYCFLFYLIKNVFGFSNLGLS